MLGELARIAQGLQRGESRGLLLACDFGAAQVFGQGPQRVWAMPLVPGFGPAASSSATLPTARTICSR